MPMISHVRVSTEDQLSLPQSVALRSAGCAEIFEEHTSDGNRARPLLARVDQALGWARIRRSNMPSRRGAIDFVSSGIRGAEAIDNPQNVLRGHIRP